MTVSDLITKLNSLPLNAEIVGSQYKEEHDEYYVERGEFTVAQYYSDVDDDVGVVYIGLTYQKPN